MEKTTTIFIAGTTFSLTESAHEKLASYLTTLKEHFGNDVSRDEIIRDIESRIAEKLAEKKERMIVLADIEAIISEIGEPTQLDQEETPEVSHDTVKGKKKLYRDTDNAWLGGVASGIAAYFDINLLWVRAAFVVATLLWGASIILYMALWILIPAAKTSGQKLEMRGIHATLENIGRVVRERAEEVQERGVVKKFFDGVTAAIRTSFRIFSKIIGFVLTVLPVLMIIGLTILFGAVITNWNTSFNDFPLRGVVPDELIFLSVTAMYAALLIPLLLLSISGIRLIRKRRVMATPVVLGLVGAWVVVLIAGSIAGTNIARHYAETLATNPRYQIEERIVEIPAFTKISVANRKRIAIKNGETQEVAIRAQVKDMERVNMYVENDTLVIKEMEISKREPCFFACWDGERAEIIITTPELEHISSNGRVNFNKYSGKELSIKMSGGSLYGSLTVPALDMTTDGGSIRASIETDALTVNARNTHFYLDGSAKSAILYLVDSYFGNELFVIDSADLETQRSNVRAKVLERVDTFGESKAAPLESENNSTAN